MSDSAASLSVDVESELAGLTTLAAPARHRMTAAETSAG
jgi:hypothetical protein